MLFRRHLPSNGLKAFVVDLWLYRGYEGAHSHERILPSGTFEIVFNLREDQLRIYSSSDTTNCRVFSGAVVSGPYAGTFLSDKTEEASLLGVHFRPGGAAPFLGAHAGEFLNTHVDLANLWGSSATFLREALCEQRDPRRQFEMMERALLEKLAEQAIPSAVVGKSLQILERTNGKVRIRELARSLDLGQRRFADLFVQQVGLSPKLFGRVLRFQYAVSICQVSTDPDWAQLAIECGYYDQSHLIRDFREFSGLSPADFAVRRRGLEEAGAHVKRNHIPVSS